MLKYINYTSFDSKHVTIFWGFLPKCDYIIKSSSIKIYASILTLKLLEQD